ncbi:MAG: hypothetical protein ACKO6F_04410 [Cyanobium sp.]
MNTAAAPASITITGSNNEIVNIRSYTTTAVAAGPVSFTWSYFSTNPGFNLFGYLLNGNISQLAGNSMGPVDSQFNVLSGDIFGFGIISQFNSSGPGIATISNFSAPVPGPLPLLGPAVAFGYCLSLRRLSKRANRLVRTELGSGDQL